MLDIKRIKENPEQVKAGLRAKEVNCDQEVDRILALDKERRDIIYATEQMKAEQNKVSKTIPQLKKAGEDTAPVFAKMGELKAQIAANDEKLRTGEGEYAISGVGGQPHGGSVDPLSCDVHESGTTCRLLTAVLAAGMGRFRVHGAPRMHERPIGELTAALETLGVSFTFEGKPGFPPFVLKTCGLDGGEVGIGMDESSQYLSGVLLAAPLARAPLTVNIGGSKVVSWPYVGLTLQALENFGVPFSVERKEGGAWSAVDWHTLEQAEPGNVRFRMVPAMYRAGRYAVEGDWSGASYLLAAGAIGPRPVRIEGLRADSLQGDRVMLDILRDMGARIDIEPDAVTVHPSELRGVVADMSRCPDLVPTVAVVAAHASGPTRLWNAAHLRIKECDRIAVPAQELSKVGVRCDEHDDGLTIHGDPALASRLHSLDGIAFSAHGDHRIAMSLALLELRGGRLTLDDPSCVSKSFPNFWECWGQVRV